MPKPRHGSGRAGRWLALAASTSCTDTAVVSVGGSLPTAYQDDGAVLHYARTYTVSETSWTIEAADIRDLSGTWASAAPPPAGESYWLADGGQWSVHDMTIQVI